jgi:hypothetical protein
MVTVPLALHEEEDQMTLLLQEPAVIVLIGVKNCQVVLVGIIKLFGRYHFRTDSSGEVDSQVEAGSVAAVWGCHGEVLQATAGFWSIDT